MGTIFLTDPPSLRAVIFNINYIIKTIDNTKEIVYNEYIKSKGEFKMKNHHNYPKVSIGSSDISELIVRGPGKVGTLAFGEDGSYRAYIADRDCDIPGYYKQVFECRSWIMIYDDEGKSFGLENHGSIYRVFQAGEFGCIIQMI